MCNLYFGIRRLRLSIEPLLAQRPGVKRIMFWRIAGKAKIVHKWCVWLLYLFNMQYPDPGAMV